MKVFTLSMLMLLGANSAYSACFNVPSEYQDNYELVSSRNCDSATYQGRMDSMRLRRDVLNISPNGFYFTNDDIACSSRSDGGFEITIANMSGFVPAKAFTYVTFNKDNATFYDGRCGATYLKATSFPGRSGLIGTVWKLEQTQQFTNGNLTCARDVPAPQNDGVTNKGARLRIDRWNDGWFRLAIIYYDKGYGCATNFINNGLALRQVGNEVFDRKGVRVGTITESEIHIQKTQTLYGGYPGNLDVSELKIHASSSDTATIEIRYSIIGSWPSHIYDYKSTLRLEE